MHRSRMRCNRHRTAPHFDGRFRTSLRHLTLAPHFGAHAPNPVRRHRVHLRTSYICHMRPVWEYMCDMWKARSLYGQPLEIKPTIYRSLEIIQRLKCIAWQHACATSDDAPPPHPYTHIPPPLVFLYHISVVPTPRRICRRSGICHRSYISHVSDICICRIYRTPRIHRRCHMCIDHMVFTYEAQWKNRTSICRIHAIA